MPIYDASLWTSSGYYRGFGPGETVALSLWYQRSFSRDQLLGITETAWRGLGNTDAAQRERWLAELRQAWDDVAPGENVTTVVVPGGPTRSGFKTPLRGDTVGTDLLKGRPPEFPVLLKQLLYQGIREWKWVEFKPQCTSSLHRVEPWSEPCLCPHCACAMEQNPRPFRIWD